MCSCEIICLRGIYLNQVSIVLIWFRLERDGGKFVKVLCKANTGMRDGVEVEELQVFLGF